MSLASLILLWPATDLTSHIVTWNSTQTWLTQYIDQWICTLYLDIQPDNYRMSSNRISEPTCILYLYISSQIGLITIECRQTGLANHLCQPNMHAIPLAISTIVRSQTVFSEVLQMCLLHVNVMNGSQHTTHGSVDLPSFGRLHPREGGVFEDTSTHVTHQVEWCTNDTERWRENT